MLSKFVHPDMQDEKKILLPQAPQQNANRNDARSKMQEKLESIAEFQKSVEKVEAWRIKCGFPPSTRLPKYQDLYY